MTFLKEFVRVYSSLYLFESLLQIATGIALVGTYLVIALWHRNPPLD